MSMLSYFLNEKKVPSNAVAKERLQIILAHERLSKNQKTFDFLPQLQKDIMHVISKYITINLDDIKVHLDRQDNLEVLEVKIDLSEKV